MLRNVTAVLIVAIAIVACRSESPYEHYVYEQCELLKAGQDQLTKDYKLDE